MSLSSEQGDLVLRECMIGDGRYPSGSLMATGQPLQAALRDAGAGRFQP